MNKGQRPRPIRPISPYLEIVPMRLNIFVPALMSVGFVFWLSALLRDQLRRRRTHRLEGRADVAGRATAAITLGHAPADPEPSSGVGDRSLYGIASLPFIGLAIYVLVGALGNYFRPRGYVSEIAWLLAASLIASVVFATIGVGLAAIFFRWPNLSPGLRRFAARSPIGSFPGPARVYAEPAPLLTGALIVTGAAAAFTALIIGSSRGFLSGPEEFVLDAVSDAEWLGTLSHGDILGASGFAIIAAALLGLASFRCRVLVAAYPFAVVTAFLSSNLLRVLIERERPPDSALAGMEDSFPSGHMIMTTILVGLLPLTAAVMLHSRRFTRPLRWLAAVAVIVAAMHRVHDETHWPTDVIGGLLIGATIVLAVEWAIAHEAWHRRCIHCPWTRAVGEPAPTGTVSLHVDVARLLGWASHLWAAAVAILLAVLSATQGIPADPEGTLIDVAIQRPIQLGLAGLVSVGTLISWRWPPVGAVMLAFAAGGLGTFASLQYEPVTALAVTVVVTAPAVLLWLSWQHRKRPGEIVGLALTTGGLLFGTWLAASFVYASVLGPTHAASDAERLPADRVEWVWLGGLGPESIRATARLDDDDVEARLVVTSGDRTWSSPLQQPTEEDLVRFGVGDLEPGRAYEYVVEVDGEPDTGRGRGTFRTPAVGPASFRLVAASCARVDSNAAVFDAIAAEDPLMYLALGDVHYSNIAENDVNTFRTAYDRMLTQPGQAALYRDVPVSYVWDDHDYGPNDSGADSPSRDAAQEAFREGVPSHQLETDDGAIHRAYTVGRVRFVVTDSRSERQGETILGAKQLAWLEDELVTASQTHALIVWMNSTPWIGEPSDSGDGWAGFAEERRHIADTLATAEVDNLLMVSGDAHMLAFDDGTNSGYATDGSPGFPVFHTAALDRPGSVKGGPYSGGTFPGFGQYGVIDISDDGTTLEVQLTGKNWKGDVLLSETLSFTD